MRRRIQVLAALGVLTAAGPAVAAGDCPALPPRSPMPMEALPGKLAWPEWQKQVTALEGKLPDLQRDSRRLVFIGDSITASWDAGLFSQFYGTRAPLLLGISGDATQGVLERLPREWGPMRPRLVVLLIGTNNTWWGGSNAEDVALGIAEIVRLIHTKSSGTRVLIVGVLPRGATPADPTRAVDARINTLVARCADGQTVFFADIGRNLLDAAGTLSNEVSFDSTHLTPVGYAIMATALEPEIKRIMGE